MNLESAAHLLCHLGQASPALWASGPYLSRGALQSLPAVSLVSLGIAGTQGLNLGIMADKLAIQGSGDARQAELTDGQLRES